jgi:hypothetical protein
MSKKNGEKTGKTERTYKTDHIDFQDVKTVTTDPMFLFWNGWDHSEFEKRGHELILMSVKGRCSHSHPRMHIKSFEGGSVSKRQDINESYVYNKITGVDLKDKIWAYFNELYSDYEFTVRFMYTKNLSTEDVCHWYRVKTQDGKMRMILMRINNLKWYTLSEKEIVGAADDMYWDGCEWFPKPPAPKNGPICGSKRIY